MNLFWQETLIAILNRPFLTEKNILIDFFFLTGSILVSHHERHLVWMIV
jgi:hypothetical protein